MRIPALLLLLSVLSACGGGGGGGGSPAPPRPLAVAPAKVILNPGEVQGFRALDSLGREVPAAWALEGGSTGLSPDGFFTAPPTPGDHRIRATGGDGGTGTAAVTVTTAPLPTPSRLGIWLWRLERIAAASSHAQLASLLRARGIRRIFLKVADGSRQNSIQVGLPWDDPAIAPAYHAQGLEVWAWSYNYPGASAYHRDQAGALLNAARNGFDGFVVDMESEFEGALPSQITDFYAAFSESRDEALRQGWIPSRGAFPLFCTTFGNVGSDLPSGQRHPLGGHFTQAQLQAADALVDGWMPQTYLEAWNKVKEPARFLAEGNRVYRACGLVKPLWHITQTEEGEAGPGDIDAFFAEAFKALGPDAHHTSVWSIPNAGQTNGQGQRVDARIWDTQGRVDWRVFTPR
ncbi:MAG: hypothetical protein HY823_04185 [Acidobacteria bacterium]|nr:hypothetical protein [Acidobacteriota bacterium]